MRGFQHCSVILFLVAFKYYLYPVNLHLKLTKVSPPPESGGKTVLLSPIIDWYFKLLLHTTMGSL